MSDQLNMFDEVKMEATEKKNQPLYTPSKEDIEKSKKAKEETTRRVTKEYVPPAEEVVANEESEVFINKDEQAQHDAEEELYNEPEEPMYEGVDGVLYPASEWFSPIIMNGPTREEVEDWKRKHKRIYYLPFDDGIYIFRALKRPEYKEIIRNVDLSALDREEMFAERCVVFPRDFTIEKANEGDAGVVSVLSDAIMEKSGFMAKTGIIKL